MVSRASQTTATLVREHRERQGLSREDLASQAALSMKTIERLEAGDPVRRATLRVVALALGVDEDKLRPDIPAAA